jgi:hypothetical protein
LAENRLGQKFGDPCVARAQHALLLGMAGEHDDRHVGIGVGAGLADHLRQFQAVEDRHEPVGEHDIRHVVGEGLEAGGAVFRFIDLAGAEPRAHGAQDAAHMGIVVDDEKTQALEIDADHAHSRGAASAQSRTAKCKDLPLSAVMHSEARGRTTEDGRWKAAKHCRQPLSAVRPPSFVVSTRIARAGSVRRGCGRDRTACAWRSCGPCRYRPSGPRGPRCGRRRRRPVASRLRAPRW